MADENTDDLCKDCGPALTAFLEGWQRRAQVRRRSCGANFATLILLADSFTMCQTAFTVIPSPQVLPTLLTLRNSLPRSIAAAASQSSSSVLTQSGTHGEEDPQVPPYESAQLVRALKKEGKIFFYYTYAHGGHGFTDREHWLDALQKQQIFLRKYLQPSYGNSSTSADDLLFSQK